MVWVWILWKGRGWGVENGFVIWNVFVFVFVILFIIDDWVGQV